ncbi:MAG: diacylglycerol/lipid kinase family protein [Hominenteromicrobium sp.]
MENIGENLPLLKGAKLSEQRVLLIVNPCAGRMKGKKYADMLEERLRSGGAAVDRRETTEWENGAGYAAQAAETNRTRIVCIGGDGTLNAVINGVLSRGICLPITYIPAGTTNDFAQTLKIPKRASEMRAALTGGRDVEIDAGQFNDSYFSYVASFGAFTKCSYATPRSMKRLLGHLAYVLEGIRDVAALEARPITVETAARTFEGEYVFGAFSNTVSIGGMLKYDSGLVDMNDGRLEMLLIRKPETLGDVHRLIHALTVGDFDDPLFDFASAEAFCMHSAAGFDWSVDGEHAESGCETQIRCVKSAVRITVPARK